jgi:hypothetical protein
VINRPRRMICPSFIGSLAEKETAPVLTESLGERNGAPPYPLPYYSSIVSAGAEPAHDSF